MIFSIKITSEDGEVIEIGKEGLLENEMNLIKDVTILMDTVNDNVRDKANAILAKIKITCRIDDRISDEVLKIFNWSKELDEKKWYRTIEIKMKTSMNNVFRTYIFEKVFIVDYAEYYDYDKSSIDHFELLLTQKENNLNTIEAF